MRGSNKRRVVSDLEIVKFNIFPIIIAECDNDNLLFLFDGGIYINTLYCCK